MYRAGGAAICHARPRASAPQQPARRAATAASVDRARSPRAARYGTVSLVARGQRAAARRCRPPGRWPTRGSRARSRSPGRARRASTPSDSSAIAGVLSDAADDAADAITTPRAARPPAAAAARSTNTSAPSRHDADRQTAAVAVGGAAGEDLRDAPRSPPRRGTSRRSPRRSRRARSSRSGISTSIAPNTSAGTVTSAIPAAHPPSRSARGQRPLASTHRPAAPALAAPPPPAAPPSTADRA